MRGTQVLVLVALLLCGLSPSHVAGKEQVQAVFAFTGVCFPVKENLVTSFINTVVNPITNSPWGTATQSGGYESLCARLPDGCTDIPGSGTGRAAAPSPAAPTPTPTSKSASPAVPSPPAGEPPASPAGGAAPTDFPPGDYNPNLTSDYGAAPPPPTGSQDLNLNNNEGSSNSGSNQLGKDGSLADLTTGGNRRLLWLEAPGLGQGQGQGRGLLQDASCSGKKWYLYLDTTNPADPEATIQMIKDSINTGDFISRMDGIPGLQPESVILKDIKTVDLPDDPPPPPPTEDGTTPPNPDVGSPPADYAPTDYANGEGATKDPSNPYYDPNSATGSGSAPGTVPGGDASGGSGGSASSSGSPSSGSSSSSSSSDSGGGGSNTVVIVGVICGVVAAAVLAAGVAAFMMRNKKKAHDKVQADLAAFRAKRDAASSNRIKLAAANSRSAFERTQTIKEAQQARDGSPEKSSKGSWAERSNGAGGSAPAALEVDIDLEHDSVLNQSHERSAPSEVGSMGKKKGFFGWKG